MGELRPWHLIILVVVIFVLFGYKKLPDATRSLGRSLRILKTEVKSLHDDDADKPATSAEAQVVVAPRAVEAAKAVSPPVTTPRVVQPPRVVEAPRATVPTVPAAPDHSDLP